MHFVPFGSYQAHYIGQTGFRVPQPATLSHPAGDKKQQIPGEPPKSKGVLYQASGVQKVRHARPLTSKAWSDEEDKKLVDLRRKGLAWTAISRELPGRTYLACRLRFGNHLSPLDKWPGNCQSHVAGYYNRQSPMVHEQTTGPWRATEVNPRRLVNQGHLAATSSLAENLDMNMARVPESQAIALPGYSLPNICGGPGPPKKQNINLPSVRMVFSDLRNVQWFTSNLAI